MRIPLLFPTTKARSVMPILKSGLCGMGRLGAMLIIYPSWDSRCTVEQRLASHPEYEVTLILHTNAVQRQLATVGRELCFNRV